MEIQTSCIKPKSLLRDLIFLPGIASPVTDFFHTLQQSMHHISTSSSEIPEYFQFSFGMVQDPVSPQITYIIAKDEDPSIWSNPSKYGLSTRSLQER